MKSAIYTALALGLQALPKNSPFVRPDTKIPDIYLMPESPESTKDSLDKAEEKRQRRLARNKQHV